MSIYTNYPCIRQHSTYDGYTALCVELEAELGRLVVYGSIIGILGNRHSSFQRDLYGQLSDVRRLTADGNNLCICGDFNCSFADGYYFTRCGRNAIRQTFSECRTALLTEQQPECIGHIAVSNQLVKSSSVQIEEWNMDKRLSDHKGISIQIKPEERTE